ncbi:MAG: tyrosine recombinase XerD, partial [Dehalococcoidia bacterium]|nr:tyrosine recombinase XerD [Dehalococcoidia bacterium]
LLSKSMEGEAPDVIRDRAMLRLLYTTGMMVTELVRLDLEDLHLDETEPYLSCIGRGGRPRALLISPDAITPLAKYLDGARERLIKSSRDRMGALFVNQRGDRLTRQGFWLILKRYAKDANLGTGITPHTLRHSFATHMLKSGRLSLPALQHHLGHSSITSTQVYAQVADETPV